VRFWTEENRDGGVMRRVHGIVAEKVARADWHACKMM
jgi:hypothetical protein